MSLIPYIKKQISYGHDYENKKQRLSKRQSALQYLNFLWPFTVSECRLELTSPPFWIWHCIKTTNFGQSRVHSSKGRVKQRYYAGDPTTGSLLALTTSQIMISQDNYAKAQPVPWDFEILACLISTCSKNLHFIFLRHFFASSHVGISHLKQQQSSLTADGVK